MGSDAVIYVSNLIKIGSGVQKVMGGGGGIHIHAHTRTATLNHKRKKFFKNRIVG
jgi:hypothetical protein